MESFDPHADILAFVELFSFFKLVILRLSKLMSQFFLFPLLPFFCSLTPAICTNEQERERNDWLSQHLTPPFNTSHSLFRVFSFVCSNMHLQSIYRIRTSFTQSISQDSKAEPESVLVFSRLETIDRSLNSVK